MRLFVILAKAAVSLGLLSYLWVKVDPAATLAQLAASDPLALACGTLVLACLPGLGAVRWRLVLVCVQSPLAIRPLLRWTYVSVFFSQVLPATIGADALRVWLAYRAGVPVKPAVNSVALDRAAMFLALAAVLAAVSPQLGSLAGMEQARYLLPLFLVASVLGLAALMLGDRLPAYVQRWRPARALGYLAADARRLFLSARFAGATLGLSWLSYAAIILSVYLFALAFGAALELADFFILVPPVLVASSLPISIGGWGTREMAMVLALGTAGVGPQAAVLVSLWLGVASILVSLPGAVLYLTDRVQLASPFDATELRRES
jgi:uncharacterized membrane protein YbhN (UPF0104 family)